MLPPTPDIFYGHRRTYMRGVASILASKVVSNDPIIHAKDELNTPSGTQFCHNKPSLLSNRLQYSHNHPNFLYLNIGVFLLDSASPCRSGELR